MRSYFNSTAYRYPNEQLILAFTILLVFLVIAITATATVCLSVVFMVIMVAFSFNFSRSHHQDLLRGAQPVSAQTSPGMHTLAQETAIRLQVEPVEIFVAPSRVLNAYTFGLLSPKVIVMHSALFDAMDRDEIQFILGHEMGHVKLGHTWLNSLVGGMAGIPSSYASAALLELAFRGWNRACEYSADRAGLLACGNPHKAISALIKLEAGPGGHSGQAMDEALQRIDAEDDTIFGSLGELLATHPLIIRRIEQIRAYTASSQYHRLQECIIQNTP